ncbi:aspartic peptidase domain-containing protein [Plectosphaerella plurivora]|uniref:Aspartic peptidase domain-containing protein n=1 Tax=Plectosphaerella plurivora TaxID=936078 RepID=A0A9P8V2N9_9PEZI|nr:aspartic peptidase domain-containing protein [Plectosphaerella plurivora]
MHSAALRSIVLFVALLAAGIESTPTPRTKRSFTVPRVKNRDFTGHDGPTELLKAYRKHDMPIPRSLVDLVEARNEKRSLDSLGGFVGTVSATEANNGVEYVSPVKVGGQTVNVAFDTGSSDLWVFGAQLDATSKNGHDVYDSSKSSSFKALEGSTFNCTYGDGSGVLGNVAMESVSVGGVTVSAQAVGVANFVSDQFVKDTGSSGLMGLAFSSLNRVRPQAQKTFFDNVMNDLAQPVFTADLRRDGAGSYEFGRIDQSKFTGDMTWIPVNSTSGFWQFTSDTFAVNNGPSQKSKDGAQAIADTGTTLILANPQLVETYYAQVQGAVLSAEEEGYVFPCDTALPDLSLDIGGSYIAKVPGADIKFSQYNENMCFGGLQPTKSKVQIFGDVLFKSQFVAFNGSERSIGFAKAVDNEKKAAKTTRRRR